MATLTRVSVLGNITLVMLVPVRSTVSSLKQPLRSSVPPMVLSPLRSSVLMSGVDNTRAVAFIVTAPTGLIDNSVKRRATMLTASVPWCNRVPRLEPSER